MKTALVVVLLFAIVGAWMVWRARAPESKARMRGDRAPREEAGAGRDLRLMMLRTPVSELGVEPTEKFPHVYAVLMDWPVRGATATVFSTSSGAASLYTTSTFGIIGGEAHERVRSAAMDFVRAANGYYERAAPTTEYPYPDEEHVRFYLLTFEGVRVLETDLATISGPDNELRQLFGLAQAVLTELRLVAEGRS